MTTSDQRDTLLAWKNGAVRILATDSWLCARSGDQSLRVKGDVELANCARAIAVLSLMFDRESNHTFHLDHHGHQVTFIVRDGRPSVAFNCGTEHLLKISDLVDILSWYRPEGERPNDESTNIELTGNGLNFHGVVPHLTVPVGLRTRLAGLLRKGAAIANGPMLPAISNSRQSFCLTPRCGSSWSILMVEHQGTIVEYELAKSNLLRLAQHLEQVDAEHRRTSRRAARSAS